MKVSLFSLLVLTALVASTLQSMRAASKCAVIKSWLGSGQHYDGISPRDDVQRLEAKVFVQESAVSADSPLSLDSPASTRYQQMVARHAELRAKR